MNTLGSTEYVISNLVKFLHDTPSKKDEVKDESKTKILEAYFNDIYKLFLAKLAKFESAPSITDADTSKLKSILDELINVKTLLAD